MIGKPVLQHMHAYKQGMQIADVKRKYNLDKIVKLASNENPYGYSEKVAETIQQMVQGYELYPDGYAYELRVKLADKLGVQPDELVFGAGSDEIITFICRAFLNEETNTVMAAPTFPQYRQHALIEGATIKEIPTKNGHHQLDAMADAIDSQTKVVWLCTPDNPTGSVIAQSDLDHFMEKCPENVVVVLDVAYDEFVDDNKKLDFLSNIKKYDNMIILKTFSKAYGIAGFRVGYGIADVNITDKLNIVRGPFNITSLSLRIAKAVIDDDEFIEYTKEKNQQVRTLFEAFLDSINWGYYPSETNFLLVKTPIDADEVTEFLLQHGFIVRSGNQLGYPNTVRITIGTKEDMKDLQSVIIKLDKQIRDGLIK